MGEKKEKDSFVHYSKKNLERKERKEKKEKERKEKSKEKKAKKNISEQPRRGGR